MHSGPTSSGNALCSRYISAPNATTCGAPAQVRSDTGTPNGVFASSARTAGMPALTIAASVAR